MVTPPPLKVCVKVAPGWFKAVLKEPSSAVTVWERSEPDSTHWTESPGLMDTSLGVKLKSATVTITVLDVGPGSVGMDPPPPPPPQEEISSSPATAAADRNQPLACSMTYLRL